MKNDVENKLITVIVPCYNVEKYIEKSIDSIMSQSYKNIETILIDDCSTDGTYDKILKLKEKYNDKIIVIKNEKNSGAAYSRNQALKIAKGDYIGFVDPDDYIDEDYYLKLYESIQNNNAWIAITDIFLVEENGNPILGPIKCYEGDKLNIESVLNCGLSASPCNKLIRADIIKNYPFLEGKMNEDVASIIPTLVMCKDNLSYAHDIKYYYVQRKNSMQNSEFSEKRFDMFEALNVCLERIKNEKNYKKYLDIVLYHQVLMLYTCVIIEIDDEEKRKEIISKFIKMQEQYELYKNPYAKIYVRSQRKVLRLYYYMIIKLLRFKSANLINNVIKLKDSIYEFCRLTKRVYKRMIGKNVLKYNIGLKDVIKAAKKQNKLPESEVKISVVIPNYNYANFMYQRLYSILSQKVKLKEIIILDDCSKDNSREVIDKIVDKISNYISIKKIYNEQNSGSPFKQWKKGFKEATGDYVWIAEADDYCSNKMLTKLTEKMKENKNIQIAYVDTAFIDKYGNIILKTIKNEIDIRHTGHWDSSFVENGMYEIEKYCFLNCIIANVSSCLIKRDNYDDVFEKISSYRQAGDWLFYNLVMKRGDICFIADSINYYRVHENNVTSLTKKQKHFDEIVRIHDENRKIVDFTPWHEEEVQKRYEFLKKVWKL